MLLNLGGEETLRGLLGGYICYWARSGDEHFPFPKVLRGSLGGVII